MEERNLLNWLKRNGHKLKIMYSYAVVNKLSIESKKDVLKILKAADPENATEEQMENYSKMLQIFRDRLRATIAKGFKS